VVERPEVTHRVAARFFDLDDTGSQISQKLAAKAALLIRQI
jgi:hypothetical protein